MVFLRKKNGLKTIKLFVFLSSLTIVLISCPEICLASEKLSLDESIDLALKNNPAVRGSKEKINAAKADLDRAYSKRYPNISVEGGFGIIYQQPITTTITYLGHVKIGKDEMAEHAFYRLKLEQPIFTWGKISNAISFASEGIGLSNLELEEVKREVAYNITDAYFSVLKTKKLLDLALEAWNVIENHYRQVKAAYNAGLVTEPDLLKVELELSLIEQNSIKAEHGHDLTKLAYNHILRNRQNVLYDIQDENFKTYTYYPEIKDESILEEAYRSRPEFKKLKILRKMAIADKNVSTGYYFPDIALAADYGWEKLDYKEDNIDLDAKNYHFTMVLDWTLFNGFETDAKVKKAEADLKQVYANESLLKKKIELEVKEALLNLRDSIKRIDNSRKSVNLAEENQRISMRRYNSGVGTSFDVVYAQRDLIQAKKELIEAQFDFEIAKAKINKITGKDIL